MKKDWGMGKDEDSRDDKGEKDYTKKKGMKSDTRKGDEDFEKHEGSKSETMPGEEDFTGHKGDDSKTDPGHKDYTPDEMADYLARESRDGPHLMELLEENNWEIREKDDKEVVTDEQIQEELGMNKETPHISVIRLRAARNGLRGAK